MAQTVLVGCRLPNGLILRDPRDKNVMVKLAGTYGGKTDSGIYFPPQPFSTTRVDLEFWTAWKAANVGFPPLKNRAVFEANSDQEAAAKGREAEKHRTGFEQMSKTAKIDGVAIQKAD